jgi:phosphoribosylanthranilate isomerase
MLRRKKGHDKSLAIKAISRGIGTAWTQRTLRQDIEKQKQSKLSRRTIADKRLLLCEQLISVLTQVKQSMPDPKPIIVRSCKWLAVHAMQLYGKEFPETMRQWAMKGNTSDWEQIEIQLTLSQLTALSKQLNADRELHVTDKIAEWLNLSLQGGARNAHKWANLAGNCRRSQRRSIMMG